jgi:hypothetical protein
MKLSKISLALTALAGVAASPAFALTAASYSASDAVNIYVSGATAQDSGLKAAVATLCTSGTVHEYTASNQSVILCTPTSAYGIASGKTQLAVYKHSVGGSGNGVAPVNNSTPLPFLDLTKIVTSCPNATGAGTVIGCSAVAATLVTTNAVAQLGISDVEPSFFGAKAGTYNNLLSVPLATVIFGVPVTTVAFTALQTAQGLTAGATDAANIPSLTTGQLQSLYSQEGRTWSAVTGVTGLTDDTVYIARRNNTSGTQKTFEAVIARTANGTSTGKACAKGLKDFLPATATAADNTAAADLCTGANVVVEGSGGNQVQVCLTTFNTNGKAAIGVLTTEQVSTAGWKHVRINGLLPNYTNVKNGSYTAYGDAALNSRVSPAIDANHSNFKAKFFGAFAATATTHPTFGTAGTDAVRAGLIELNSVTGLTTGNPYSRLDADGNVDNCRPALLND